MYGYEHIAIFRTMFGMKLCVWHKPSVFVCVCVCVVRVLVSMHVSMYRIHLCSMAIPWAQGITDTDQMLGQNRMNKITH
jgi:hypothetical protein